MEGDIAERDKLIDAIRGELGSTKSENTALRQEVAALKKAILEGRASPMLPPPAPLSPLSPASSISPLSTSLSANTSSNNKLLKPNTTKDIPTSPRLAAAGGAFWGGQAGGFGSFGGFTPVHTTLIPEYGYGMPSIIGKPSYEASVQPPISAEEARRRANENMNPALNQNSVPLSVAASKVFAPSGFANGERKRSSSPVLSTMPAPATSNTISESEADNSAMYNQNLLMSHFLGQLYGGNGFDAFSDVNPFTLKTLDSYRMQLWGRMAAQQSQRRTSGVYNAVSTSSEYSSPASSPSPSLNGLASNLRPHFFASTPNSPSSSKGSSPLSALLSGKAVISSTSSTSAAHAYPTPPTSPKASERQTAQASQAQMQQQAQSAIIATLASQTLMKKMGQAFWDAFSGQSGSSSAGPSGQRGWDAEKVRKVMDGSAVLKVVDVESVTPKKSAEVALEESMRTMSIGSSSSSSMSGKDDGFLQRCKSKMNCK